MKNKLYRLIVAGACRRKDSKEGVSWFCFGILVVGMALLLGPGAPAMRGQSTSTGTVSGQVTDQQNAAVSGASVTLRDVTTNAEQKTVTNEAGRYTFVNVHPGLYDMTVTKTGFIQ